jgi:16S rRNA processing protein RimM
LSQIVAQNIDGKQTMNPNLLPNDAIEVGRVLEAYGVKGGIKLQPFSNSADGLLRVKEWCFQSPTGALKAVAVDSAKWHGDVVTATIKDLTDRDQVQSLKGWTVWVSQAALPTTSAGEYYWRDLIGCQAIADDGRALGLITDLSDTGVHAVLHVDCGAQYEPTLIPFVNEYVGAVDLIAKTVQTQWQWDWLDEIVEKPPKPTRPKKVKPSVVVLAE